MLDDNAITEAALVEAWRNAAVCSEVKDFFLQARATIDKRVQEERPLCLASGACCNFEKHGHLLYVSGLEAAFTVLRLEALHGIEVRAKEIAQAKARGDCPYLTHGFCGAHQERPLGCRIYYCDPRATHWQSDLYESTHKGVQDLHATLDIPYRYLEWREALRRVSSHT